MDKGRDIIISPIFYMGNKKKLINKGLIDLFPKDIRTFIDCFSGSGIVSMNVKANRWVVNDIDIHLNNFYDMFKKNNHKDIIKTIEENISRFDMNRGGVKQNSPESLIYKPRYINLRNWANGTCSYINIYTCMFFAFSQQMRFNNKGKFNMPFGNGCFSDKNKSYIKNGCQFFQNENVLTTNKDFREIKIENLSEEDFVYFDPPYFNTTATYNENGGWQMKEEIDLLKLCENLNEHNIKWGMSNVFKCKGKENSHLIDWCNENNWNVYYFDKFSYMACGKGNSEAQEVYICNY